MKDKIVIVLKHIIAFVVYGAVFIPAIVLPMAFMWLVAS